MTKQLLLLCAIVDTVLGTTDQSKFVGFTGVDVRLSTDVTWHSPPRWCGGHNYIRTLRLGKANTKKWPNAFFSAVSMYCHYDDYGQGATFSDEERIVEKMDKFDGRFYDNYLECRVPLDFEEDGFRGVTFYGHSWDGGFGLAKAHCNSRSDKFPKIESDHLRWSSKSATVFPLECPRKEVFIAIRAAFTTKGLVAVKSWCGSVLYHEYMPSIDFSYGEVTVVGSLLPGQRFDGTALYSSTQDPVICPDGAYMSGYTIVTAINAAFYNMMIKCTDGSDVAATRIVPEGKINYTYYKGCSKNGKRIPVKSMDVILDYEGNKYSFPGVELGCIDGSKNEEHNSHFTWGFSDPFVFKHLVCPAYQLAVGIIPVSQRILDGKGITGIQLVCKEAPECKFF